MFKFHHYQLVCTERGLKYFPSGLRDGVLVELDSCWGEWAPMAGIHDHSVSDVINQLDRIKAKKIIWPVSSPAEMADWLKSFPYPASYVLSMMSYHGRIQKKARLAPPIKPSVLVLGDAEACIDRGYRCLKIKVGSTDIKRDIDLIKTIAMRAGKQIKLRLDANRKYSYQESLSLWLAVLDLNIEYFEEPSYELDRLELLADRGMPIALDESFHEGDSLELLVRSKINYLVIKPSRFSSVYQIMMIAESCKKQDIQLIFSPCFESDFSHMISAYLIDELGFNDNFHGTFDQDFFIKS